jgi:hypothetical protein
VADIDFDSYIGIKTSEGTVVVERAPVTEFASALTDRNKVYRNPEVAASEGFDNIPAPPTYGFVAQNWGKWSELQPPADPNPRNVLEEVMGGLMAGGGIILHGEQEFTYHQPLLVGQQLDFSGEVKKIYQKATGDKTMTFIVVEDTYSDASGDPVITSTMNLIHRG